jgi:predicted metal-binding membrane protein
MSGRTDHGLAAPVFAAVYDRDGRDDVPGGRSHGPGFPTVQAGKRARGESFVATWIFVGAYALVQAASGVLAYAGAVTAGVVASSVALTAAQAARIGGCILIIAGIYQVYPWKEA